jgi:membrane-associated PAP2 superfamily phosphatase
MKASIVVIILLCFTCFVFADDDSSAQTSVEQPTPMPSSTVVIRPTTMDKFLPNLKSNFVHIFSKQNVAPAMFTALATAISSTADDDIHDYFKNHHPGQATETIFGTLGKPYVLAPSIATMLLIGQHKGSGRFHDFAYTLAQAYVLNYALVGTMKYAVGRERPDGSNHQSFPSGHAADGFMIASVIHHFYGPKGGVFGYTFGVLMASSRLKIDKHWISDVVAGASLGYLVGSAVCHNMGFHLKGEEVSMLPLVQPSKQRYGVSLYARF